MSPASAYRKARQRIEAFGASTRANVAVTFCLAAIPVMGAVGAAIDYSSANNARAALNGYADMAALSAVNRAAMQLNKSTVKSNAKKFFKAQADTLKLGKYTSVTVKVTEKNGTRTAVVSYTAQVPTTLMALLHFDSIDVAGSSTASSGQATFMDFYLLLDNTPSMGVGATPADVATMVANTPDKCAFACHDLSAAPHDYYTLAKNLGVTTRIDVVRSATQQLMDTAASTATAPDQFRVALYTFGSSAKSPGLSKVYVLSSNLSSAKTAANNIDLMTAPYQGYNNDQDTDYDNVLIDVGKEIDTPGDGSDSSHPQKWLFMVSDGVADAYYPATCSQPTTGGRCQEPLTVAGCTALKNRGIKIAVLYTTYLALPTNAWYMSWINPFNPGPYGPSVNSKIAKNMEACASPGFYFEVSPTDGISQAMVALFQKAVQSARLTK
jgi:Putative Flp pilus-assembly TadE/G-like